MAKLGGSLGKKPHSFYGVGTGSPHKGAGSTSYKPAPYKPKAKKQGRKMRPQVVDVYGSGSSGGGGYSRSGGGGYGGGSSSDYYAQQASLEKARFEFEKQQAKKAEAEAKAQRYAGKVANRASYENNLAMINAAIKNAKGRYDTDVADWRGREQTAIGDINKIFGGAIGSTQALNEQTTGAIGQHATAAKSLGQSVIEAIEGRNAETVEGLQGNLDQMGLGQGLQEDVGGVSEALSLAGMQARGDQANTAANFGLQQGAQQAIGGWNVSGLQSDQANQRTDASRQVDATIAELQRTLQTLLQEQDQAKLSALGEYNARRAELSY